MSPFERYRIVRQVLSAELAKPYGFGWSAEHSDCFFTGCAVADALDPSLRLVATYCGAYRTLAGAQRALRKRGFKSLSALFESHLKPIPIAQGVLGDLAVLRFTDGDHVGVCLGDRVATKLPAGRSDHELSAAIAMFEVGR